MFFTGGHPVRGLFGPGHCALKVTLPSLVGLPCSRPALTPLAFADHGDWARPEAVAHTLYPPVSAASFCGDTSVWPTQLALRPATPHETGHRVPPRPRASAPPPPLSCSRSHPQ